MEFENFKFDFRNPDEFYNISKSFCISGMKFYFTQLFVAITELASEVVYENNSAHSLVIGTIIANSFICPFILKWLQHYPKLQNPNSLSSSFLFQFKIYP